ncbi:MAG TPA: hypothetical protein VJ044_10835 [Candidatus Hodarchaeales archaeon]|uniref:Uncharacterized protein n=2 Tax=Candidatus Chisholmiibacteriota TaxID=1817900 RepID=A0A1G1VLY0_9BACT|nr:MAG: hypothetical protein A2785_01545 [Candidatus Chisholmbacteria bacterium RIFCSPHIGHO2_01_FULL_49_18]OGY21771.1 MAG: hypothetical protein A3A65_02275 [Candidatus Chisholmbacteria bacterium RIFCSPLOWO2_01_FULL_49_14]HKZ41449.1 hypothetical protein [Candidatus Hodarchaeales archaeon]
MTISQEIENNGEVWTPTSKKANPHPNMEAGERVIRVWGEFYESLPEENKQRFRDQWEVNQETSVRDGL